MFDFSYFKMIISFGLEIARFVYLRTFVKYQKNMQINLKLIQWIKNMQKTLLKHHNQCFKTIKGLIKWL
jgi:hypothetical protein